MLTEIIYKGAVIGTVAPGESKVLKCNGKKMTGDVTIKAGERTEIRVDGAVIAVAKAGETKTIKCAGITMKSNIEIRVEDSQNGKDGFSPTVELIDISGGTRITITDINGPKSADIMDGKDGKDGVDGKNGIDGKDGVDGYTPVKGVDYFDGKDGKDGVDGKDGADGKDGEQGAPGFPGPPGVDGIDGISPVVSVIKVGKETTIAITDKNGTKTATILDGVDGVDGTNGNDGVSPVVSVASITGGNRITIIDKNGTKTVDVMDGNDGSNGKDGRGIKTVARTSGNGAAGTTDTYTITYTDNTTSTFSVYNGKDGTNGTNGKDGTSVTVANVSESTTDGGSNVVTFSDGKTLTVKNGSKGSAGMDGSDGRDGADGKTPVKGVDYYTEADKSEFSEYIASELAKRGQLKPEFVNSIEECTDTSKMYVLPDGFIYAYLAHEVPGEVVPNFTNRANTNGADWETNKRYSTSGFADNTGTDVSNYIPAKSGDIIRVKGWDVYSPAQRFAMFDSSKTRVNAVDGAIIQDSIKAGGEYGGTEADGVYWFKLITNAGSKKGQAFATAFNYVRLVGASLVGNYSNVIITVNEPITYTTSSAKVEYKWTNTGHAFVPADYEDRIIKVETETADHETRLKILEANDDGRGVPAYWLGELEAKADTIQRAIEISGRNKSAFLWYTDAHWTHSAKMSPLLLKYLAKNTPINKVNFGGDIVGDPSSFTHENIKYVYEWRKMVADLPNHHSVYGNHDVNHRSTDVSKIAYSLLLAPEETAEMVVGGDSYYYIDNPSEKTRYLYLSYITGDHNAMTAQGQFIVNAISNVADGWHIVAIAHRWYQYTSASTPTVGSVPAYEAEILSVFDAYNARTTRSASNYFAATNFASGKGKVEFCIGGHIHVDYDFTSTGGIPVIITAADTNQERASGETEDSGTLGTITESAVFGIIADYDNRKITVVGVGRGGSREISY